MSWPDVSWYRDVNAFTRHTPFLHQALAAYALWGGLVLLAGMLVVAYLAARRRPDGPRAVALTAAAGIGVVAALQLNQNVLSPAVARPRPCHALAHVQVLLACGNDYSFPSDHCVLAGAFTVGLFTVGRRWGLTALVLSLLLAFARVYTGVHYPSDAAAGLAFGALVEGFVLMVLTRPLTRVAEWLAAGRLRPLVHSTARDAVTTTCG